jgi:hypothetical protein
MGPGMKDVDGRVEPGHDDGATVLTMDSGGSPQG